jgi:ketosteroid isomerase-like protein
MKSTAALLVLSLLALPAALAAAENPQGPEAVTAAFHDALARGDRARVTELLASDVVIFESGGAELSRAEYASHHLGDDMEFAQATKEEVVAREAGESGDAAWVLTRSRTTGTFREKKVDLRGTETMLLRKSADGWRIVHIHWSSAKVK